MNSDAGAAIFLGILILAIAIGAAFEAWIGWSVLGGGLILMGIFEAAFTYVRGKG